MEKQLIDYYLLDNHAQVVNGSGKPHLVQELCAFERCLLIESLVRVGMSGAGQSEATNNYRHMYHA
jgi:hypothetical protein